jgi:hypothetical protein
MGRLKNGILGGLNGKVGKIIGYNLNGQDVIRTIGVTNKPASEKQLNNKLQMQVIMQFFKKMNGLLKMGFNPKAKNTTKNFHNLAISYNKPHALIGFYPHVTIDFSKIVISVGDLPQPENIQVKLIGQTLEFTWEGINNTDQVMLLAYSPNTKQMVFESSGAKRAQKKEILSLIPGMENELLELYISFVSDDRTQVADSLYLGNINHS